MSRTLTELLREHIGYEAESDPEAQAEKNELEQIKSAVKEWLTQVDCSPFLSEERMRRELIVLVDEPPVLLAPAEEPDDTV